MFTFVFVSHKIFLVGLYSAPSPAAPGGNCPPPLLRLVKAKFHYMGPTGPARTRTDFVGDPHGPNGVSRRPGPQKSPCVSGRARVVEFSYYATVLNAGCVCVWSVR